MDVIHVLSLIECHFRYVNKLYDLHLSAENYIEAGFTLFLYASSLEVCVNKLITVIVGYLVYSCCKFVDE